MIHFGITNSSYVSHHRSQAYSADGRFIVDSDRDSRGCGYPGCACTDYGIESKKQCLALQRWSYRRRAVLLVKLLPVTGARLSEHLSNPAPRILTDFAVKVTAEYNSPLVSSSVTAATLFKRTIVRLTCARANEFYPDIGRPYEGLAVQQKSLLTKTSCSIKRRQELIQLVAAS